MNALYLHSHGRNSASPVPAVLASSFNNTKQPTIRHFLRSQNSPRSSARNMASLNNESYLSRLPAELIIRFFCSAESFFDALHLAATCTHIQAIWRNNVNTIYNQISRQLIPCRRYARDLLACQIGTPPSSPVAVKDVVQLLRNFTVVEKSADWFNQTIVCSKKLDRNSSMYTLCSSFLSVSDCLTRTVDGKTLPPYLTQTERIRFIRALYQLWEIVLLDHENLKKKTETLLFRDIMTINDFAMIDTLFRLNFIQDKQVLKIRAADPALMSKIAHKVFRPAILFIIKHVLGSDRMYCGTSSFMDHGFCGMISIWDNYQRDFKAEITMGGNGPTDPNPDVWYDTDDEMD